MGCYLTKASLCCKRRSHRHLTEKRVLLLGLDNSGKTSILLQLKENQFLPEIVPTIGLNIEKVRYGKSKYNLTFWDVGGQVTKLWKHYFDSVDGLVFVIDATDRERIARAKIELSGLASDQALQSVPFLLMFNKIDMAEQRMSLEELTERLGVEELSQNRVINFQECSAKTAEGVWEGVSTLVDIFEGKTDSIVPCDAAL